jgi:hypothetical protein
MTTTTVTADADLYSTDQATASLPMLVDRASKALAGARTSAEILDARDQADVVYTMAKKAARMAEVKGAHDALIAAAYRAQADALLIQAAAQRRLADEYDAAQERGEVAKLGTNQSGVPEQNTRPATAEELGISRKDVHDARIIRDAEKAEPGIVKRTVDAAVKSGKGPTKADVKRAVAKAANREKNQTAAAPPESGHEHDLRMLETAWEFACESARKEFCANLIKENPDWAGRSN